MRYALAWFTVLVLLLYGFGNPLVFAWYLPIIFIGWLQILVVGSYYFAVEVARRLQKRIEFPMSASTIHAICMVIPFVLLVNSTYFAWQEHRTYTAPNFFGKEADHFRILAYQEAAEFINERGGQSDTIAAAEIGALGFYSRFHVYDACGLVTPEAIPFLPVPQKEGFRPNTGHITAEFAESVDADWIVTMPRFGKAYLFPSEWFKENYVLADRIPLLLPTWGDKYVHVYRHKQ
jgi:hypothetical protein